MTSKEVCTIKVVMEGVVTSRTEDVVKNNWPYVLPWFTRRHGVDSGQIILDINESYGEKARVTVHWEYTREDEEDSDDHD